MDNKLNIYFGEDKTKSELFALNVKVKMKRKLNINYVDIEIKQPEKAVYLIL